MLLKKHPLVDPRSTTHPSNGVPFMLISSFYAYQRHVCYDSCNAATKMLRLMLIECGENLKSSLLGTPSFSETVCPVGVFAPAKIVIHVR